MKTIFLVEDNPFLIDIYKKKLEIAGFKLKIAETGGKAMHLLKEKAEEAPDLFILDIVLPEFDGWEILKSIKENPKFKNSKVIILSNLGQKEDIQKSQEMGADKYLIKAHFVPSEIVEEIKKLI
ncbi:response regulator [Patescibacteria group bacterium]|nr:response regulator [Patescibacteria group bacterium]